MGGVTSDTCLRGRRENEAKKSVSKQAQFDLTWVNGVDDEQKPHDNDQIRESGLVLRGTSAPITKAYDARRDYRGSGQTNKAAHTAHRYATAMWTTTAGSDLKSDKRERCSTGTRDTMSRNN